jgi:hypothetical protein
MEEEFLQLEKVIKLSYRWRKIWLDNFRGPAYFLMNGRVFQTWIRSHPFNRYTVCYIRSLLQCNILFWYHSRDILRILVHSFWVSNLLLILMNIVNRSFYSHLSSHPVLSTIWNDFQSHLFNNKNRISILQFNHIDWRFYWMSKIVQKTV